MTRVSMWVQYGQRMDACGPFHPRRSQRPPFLLFVVRRRAAGRFFFAVVFFFFLGTFLLGAAFARAYRFTAAFRFGAAAAAPLRQRTRKALQGTSTFFYTLAPSESLPMLS